MKVCCGGILGMGEEEADRVEMLVTLANLAEPAGKRADQHADPDRRHAARTKRRRSRRSSLSGSLRSRAS